MSQPDGFVSDTKAAVHRTTTACSNIIRLAAISVLSIQNLKNEKSVP